MKIKPLHNHVVIKQQDETETMYGNIVVPDMGKEKPLMGEVLAIGPGVHSVTGTWIETKVQVGQDLARSLNPAVRSQLIEFYGVGEGDLTAFVLDADRALPLIQKQAKAAQFVGIGRATGFTLGGMTARQAENIAGTESYAKLSEAELSKALGAAGQLRSTQERLARLEGVTYNEQEALSAVIEGNQTALLASQQRAQREAARFSTRGGVSGSTLRSTTAI